MFMSNVISKSNNSIKMTSHNIHASNVNKVITTSSIETLKETLISTSITLLQDHGIKQKQVFDWIREGLHTYSETFPKERVLYNSTYGGYGLNNEFISYCDIVKHKRDNNRTKYVKHIKPFGEHILKQEYCNGLFQVLYLYEHYNFDEIVSLVKEYKHKVEKKQNIASNLLGLQEYLKCPKSTYCDETNMKKKHKHYCYYKPSSFLFSGANITYDRFKKEDLEEFLETYTDTEIMNEINACKNNILKHVPEYILDELDVFIDEYNKLVDDYIKTHLYESRENNKTFLQLLINEGYTNRKTWRYQNKYEDIGILFLSKKQKDYLQQLSDTNSYNDQNKIYDFAVFNKNIEILSNVKTFVIEHFGLLCASSLYCELDIEEVPSMMDWTIGEYDGKESVYVI